MEPTLAELLQAHIETTGVSQATLARELGVSSSYMSQLVNGRITWPVAKTRRDIAKLLGLSHLTIIVAAGELEWSEVADAGKVGVVEHDTDGPAAQLAERIRTSQLNVYELATLEILINGWMEDRTKAAAKAKGE